MTISGEFKPILLLHSIDRLLAS